MRRPALGEVTIKGIADVFREAGLHDGARDVRPANGAYAVGNGENALELHGHAYPAKLRHDLLRPAQHPSVALQCLAQRPESMSMK